MGMPAEVVVKALRKMVAALQGLRHEPVVIGSLAHQAWGSGEAQQVELLVPTGEAQREQILSAARGEGLQQDGPVQARPEGSLVRLRYTDARLGASAAVELLEAATPFHQKVLGRGQPHHAVPVQVRVATCEDLILLRAGSAAPADRESIVQLLRGQAGRIDPQYLKSEAEAAGVFDRVKSAWQEAKQRA